ncbi:hypothetical protein LPJ75_002196, partial [Coemansia sp. RSA 2598]
KLVDILSTSAALSNIQKLEFMMRGVQFENIVSVIRNCPQLQTIKLSEFDEYPSIGDMEGEVLVRHLETEAYPLSKYLTSISVSGSEES